MNTAQFVGVITSGTQSWNRTIEIELDGDILTITTDPMQIGILALGLRSTDPAVKMFFLRWYVLLQNQEARVRSLPENKRRKERRQERAAAARQETECPACRGAGEIEYYDRMMQCPRCLGTRFIV